MAGAPVKESMVERKKGTLLWEGTRWVAWHGDGKGEWGRLVDGLDEGGEGQGRFLHQDRCEIPAGKMTVSSPNRGVEEARRSFWD